jgi:hypothetical protein
MPSPDLYNIGSLTLSLWNDESESTVFADDGGEVVWGWSASECQQKAIKAAEKVIQWFDAVGLTLNAKKSEIVGFGFDPDPIVIQGEEIVPSKTLKFLGCHIQSNLKWDKQVKELCNRIRSSAGRIRAEGRHFGSKDRLVLYYGWIQGSLLSNAAAFLPLLDKGQMSELQVACNMGIRAVFGLPKKGNYPLTEIRCKNNIESVEEIRQKLVLYEAWKARANISIMSTSGYETRSRVAGNVPAPMQKGWAGKMIRTIATSAFNELPEDIRKENDHTKAKKKIKRLIHQ